MKNLRRFILIAGSCLVFLFGCSYGDKSTEVEGEKSYELIQEAGIIIPFNSIVEKIHISNGYEIAFEDDEVKANFRWEGIRSSEKAYGCIKSFENQDQINFLREDIQSLLLNVRLCAFENLSDNIIVISISESRFHREYNYPCINIQ